MADIVFIDCPIPYLGGQVSENNNCFVIPAVKKLVELSGFEHVMIDLEITKSAYNYVQTIEDTQLSPEAITKFLLPAAPDKNSGVYEQLLQLSSEHHTMALYHLRGILSAPIENFLKEQASWGLLTNGRFFVPRLLFSSYRQKARQIMSLVEKKNLKKIAIVVETYSYLSLFYACLAEALQKHCYYILGKDDPLLRVPANVPVVTSYHILTNFTVLPRGIPQPNPAQAAVLEKFISAYSALVQESKNITDMLNELASGELLEELTVAVTDDKLSPLQLKKPFTPSPKLQALLHALGRSELCQLPEIEQFAREIIFPESYASKALSAIGSLFG